MKKNSGYKWEVLALLWIAFFVNQADRQVFNVVRPLIREDLLLSDGYLAGYIGERFGWKSAFYIFGAVGVIHAVAMVFRLKDNEEINEIQKQTRVKFLESMKVLFKIPSALILTIGFTGLIFVLVGYLTWIPTYQYEEFNMSLSKAGFHSMFYTYLFAFVGIILAEKYSGKLAFKDPGLRMFMHGVGLLVAVPFIVLMGTLSTLFLVYIGFAGFGFARSFFDANTYAVLYDVVPEKYHLSASGVMLMIGFGTGSLAAVILGYLKPVLGLSFGISILGAVWFVCGLLMVMGYKYYFQRDYDRVHQEQHNHA